MHPTHHSRTTEEIIRYTSTKYKNGADVERSLANRYTSDMPNVGVELQQDLLKRDMIVWKMQVNHRVAAESITGRVSSAYALIMDSVTKPILKRVEVRYAAVQRQTP
jgi:hypothetical protein